MVTPFFQEQRRHPPVLHEQASTLQSLEMALGRVQVQEKSARIQCWKRARYVLLPVPLATGCVTKLSLRLSNSPPPLLAPLPRRKLAWRPSKQFGKAFILSVSVVSRPLLPSCVSMGSIASARSLISPSFRLSISSALLKSLSLLLLVLTGFCLVRLRSWRVGALSSWVGQWPSAAADGAVVFVPKDPSLSNPGSGDYRPFAMCSAIYRLWAGVRRRMLASKWLPFWSRDSTYGLPKGRPAEVLAYRTCQQIVLAEADVRSAC